MLSAILSKNFLSQEPSTDKMKPQLLQYFKNFGKLPPIYPKPNHIIGKKAKEKRNFFKGVNKDPIG